MKARIAARIAAARQATVAPELHVSAIEPHYTPDDIAKLWKVSVCKVRRDFRDRPGVLKFVSRNRNKREYTTLRIPQSVLERFHQERTR